MITITAKTRRIVINTIAKKCRIKISTTVKKCRMMTPHKTHDEALIRIVSTLKQGLSLIDMCTKCTHAHITTKAKKRTIVKSVHMVTAH